MSEGSCQKKRERLKRWKKYDAVTKAQMAVL